MDGLLFPNGDGARIAVSRADFSYKEEGANVHEGVGFDDHVCVQSVRSARLLCLGWVICGRMRRAPYPIDVVGLTSLNQPPLNTTTTAIKTQAAHPAQEEDEQEDYEVLPPECEADDFPVVILRNVYTAAEAEAPGHEQFFADLEMDMLQEVRACMR